MHRGIPSVESMDPVSMIMGGAIASVFWIAIAVNRPVPEPEPCAREHVDD